MASIASVLDLDLLIKGCLFVYSDNIAIYKATKKKKGFK